VSAIQTVWLELCPAVAVNHRVYSNENSEDSSSLRTLPSQSWESETTIPVQIVRRRIFFTF